MFSPSSTSFCYKRWFTKLPVDFGNYIHDTKFPVRFQNPHSEFQRNFLERSLPPACSESVWIQNGEGAFLILHVLIYDTRFPVQFQNHHSKLQRNLLENSRRCLLLLQNLYELQIGEEAFPIPSRNTSLTFLYWTISQYESQRSQSLATPITLSTPSQY